MIQLESIPLHWVHRLSFLSRKRLADGFQSAGHHVSAEEWAILLILWQDEGQGPAALAERTIRDRTTVTRLLDGMEKKGWIIRVSDPNDRRRFQVQLTETGRALEASLVPLAQTHMAQAFDGISDKDIAQACALLQRMFDNLMHAPPSSATTSATVTAIKTGE